MQLETAHSGRGSIWHSEPAQAVRRARLRWAQELRMEIGRGYGKRALRMDVLWMALQHRPPLYGLHPRQRQRQLQQFVPHVSARRALGDAVDRGGAAQ